MKVVQDPANAQEAAAAGKIPIAMPSGKLAPAWLPAVPHAATHQNGGADEVATAAPAADAIPKALADGKLAVGWLPAGDAGGVAALDASKFVLGSGLVVAGDQVVGRHRGSGGRHGDRPDVPRRGRPDPQRAPRTRTHRAVARAVERL
jgi:hypothetical protein